MSITARLTRSFPAVDIRGVAVALSCLLSLIAIASDPLLNDDAFEYLRAAELFPQVGLGGVFADYGWFCYSVIIALLDGVLPSGPLFAAHLFNIAAYAMLVYTFISLVAEYRDSPRLRLFAALVILCFPLINEMRHQLVRDFAFWALSLAALLQLIRYHRSLYWRHAVLWCLAMLGAALFRLESLILLLLAPFSLLCNSAIPPGERLRGFFLMLGLVLGGAALTWVAALAAGLDLGAQIQYAYRWYLPRLFEIDTLMRATAGQLNQAIFDPQYFPGNSAHGTMILALAYVYAVAANLVNALGIPFTLLFVYGLAARHYRISSHAWLPPVFFVATSLLALLVFIFIMHFLTQRYAALAAIVLISFLPLCLDVLYNRARVANTLRRFHLLFGCLVFYTLVDSLVSFGYSNAYIEEAIDWTRANLTADDTLRTNNLPIAYFSGQVEEYDAISLEAGSYLDELRSGQVLALEVDYDEPELRDRLEADSRLNPVARFANRRDDAIIIYRAAP